MQKYDRSEIHKSDENIQTSIDATLKEVEAEISTEATEDFHKRLEEAQAEAAKQTELYLRTMADLDNLRRRTLREREELRKTASTQLIEAILPSLDSFSIGFTSASSHPEASEVTRGFKMAYDQLLQALVAQGLSIIDPLGEAFDPHAHECIAQRKTTDTQEGCIIEVVRVGYRLAEKLIRPATVIIAS